MRAPDFWYRRPGLTAALLSPLGFCYGAAGRLRAALTTPWTAPVPVICCGNLTVGGAGKTPTAIAVARAVAARGRAAAFLTRGYGGAARGPLKVDLAVHDAAAVGDEPLLLAAEAPTFVSRDRRAGAQAAVLDGADVIVMDDGLTNPGLRQDLSLVVVDGATGFGNGRVVPAGPLRERLARGIARAHAFVLVGTDLSNLAAALAERAPVLAARLVPDIAARSLHGRRVFAFAGIGRPAKFFDTLAELGAQLVGQRALPDHHPYSADEAMALVDTALRYDATPVTTRKDHVRLPEAVRKLVVPVAVDLVFDDPVALERLIDQVLPPD